MKHKNLYIKACFALNLSIKISRTHYTPSLSRTHLHSGSTSYSPAIHQSHTNATGLVTVQHYLLVRGLLRRLPVLYRPCISGNGPKSAPVSASKIGTKSRATQERVPQGGASIPHPVYTWIVKNGPPQPFHWCQSGNIPKRRQQQPRERKGMRTPSKNPFMADLT